RLIAAVTECAAEMSTSSPRVIETDLVSTPAAAGIFRPVLLLPPALADLLGADDLYAVIRHELAHAQRRDVLCGLLVALATRLHWFNPLIWLAAARYRTERELACDERVLA